MLNMNRFKAHTYRFKAHTYTTHSVIKTGLLVTNYAQISSAPQHTEISCIVNKRQ